MSLAKKVLLEGVKNSIVALYQNYLWLLTFLSIFIKSMLFLGLLPSTNAHNFDFNHAFYATPHVGVFVCFILIFLSLALLLKGRIQQIYIILFNMIFTLLIIADLWYYRAFGNFISLYLVKQTSSLENLSSSIISMINAIDSIFTLDLILIIMLVIKNDKLKLYAKRSSFACLFFITLSLAYISIAHYSIDIRQKGRNNNILIRICWRPNQTMSNLSPIGYHLLDAYSYFKNSKPLVLTNQDKKEISTWFNNKKEFVKDNEYKGKYKGKNLIVIQVESLENFVIDKKVNNQEITPNINRLLSNCLYFSKLHEQVYNGTSSDAELMTNTSVFPVRSGSTFYRFPYNSYNSLPKLMAGEGYKTLVVHPDKGSYWNWMPALKSIGFQKCIDSTSFSPYKEIGMGIGDGDYFNQAFSFIKKERQPFYAFLVTLTSHAPFDLPKEYRGLNMDKSLDSSKLGGYFQSIHYTDKQIGAFIDKLDKEGLLKNSTVVVYGDHCGIHKFYQEDVLKIKPSESWWIDDHHEIPLLIYNKDSRGREIPVNAGEIDIMPTILYLMGINEDKYINTAMGRNLLKTNKDFAVLADKEYIGNAKSELEKKEAIEGIDIADKIIRSDYFKN
ncbi:MAG: LTA synthase family protein [Bacillota bacterium]|nr:LTA synthase family protein [Bacillota bacterium]